MTDDSNMPLGFDESELDGHTIEELTDYLRFRRALGYRLDRPEKLLGQFLDHLEQSGADVVTTEAALNWSRLPVNAESN